MNTAYETRDNEFIKVFGEVLNERRRRLHLTRQELAARIGCNASLVTYWEKGKVTPPLGKLPAVAAALGTRASTMLLEVEMQLRRSAAAKTQEAVA